MINSHEAKNKVESTVKLIAVAGVVLAGLWLVIAVTSSLNAAIGWILYIVVTALSLLQITIVGKLVNLNPMVWVFLTLAIAVGTVAFTLSIVGVSHMVFGLIAGIAGGVMFILTALAVKGSQ